MPGIPEDVVQRVQESTDIVELIGSYLPLKRAGTDYVALCPFHNERTPSFSVSPSKQMFYCFGCQTGGGAFQFVMQYENTDFPSAVRKLAERAGIIIPEEALTAEDSRKYSQRKDLLRLHHEACNWFHRNLMRSKAAADAREYLKNRGVDSEIAREWRLGYAPDSWNAFLNWAKSQNYSEPLLIASGLVKEKEGTGRVYDRFRNRIMFPIINDVGEPIAFSGRTLEKNTDTAKYLNSPETPLFHKGSVFFGLHKSKRAIIKSGCAIVMEGQMDLISAFEAGVENVIAPQGTAFTEKQARILRRFAQEAVLCFDADNAGQNAAEKSLPALLRHNVTVRVATMPPGEDPDSLIRSQGSDAFKTIIAQAPDFFEQRLEQFLASPEARDPRARIDFARKIIGLALPIQEPMLRDPVLQNIRSRLEMSQEDLDHLTRQEARQARHVPDPDDHSPAGGSPAAPPPRQLLPIIKLLCQSALTSHEAREFLRSRKRSMEILAANTDGDLLISILQANLPESNEGPGYQDFLNRLPSADQSLIARFLQERPPPKPLEVARDCWIELQRRRLRQQQDALQQRLRNPDLSPEEMADTQKEILDLKKLLQDIATLSN